MESAFHPESVFLPESILSGLKSSQITIFDTMITESNHHYYQKRISSSVRSGSSVSSKVPSVCFIRDAADLQYSSVPGVGPAFVLLGSAFSQGTFIVPGDMATASRSRVIASSSYPPPKMIALGTREYLFEPKQLPSLTGVEPDRIRGRLRTPSSTLMTKCITNHPVRYQKDDASI